MRTQVSVCVCVCECTLVCVVHEAIPIYTNVCVLTYDSMARG